MDLAASGSPGGALDARAEVRRWTAGPPRAVAGATPLSPALIVAGVLVAAIVAVPLLRVLLIAGAVLARAAVIIVPLVAVAATLAAARRLTDGRRRLDDRVDDDRSCPWRYRVSVAPGADGGVTLRMLATTARWQVTEHEVRVLGAVRRQRVLRRREQIIFQRAFTAEAELEAHRLLVELTDQADVQNDAARLAWQDLIARACDDDERERERHEEDRRMLERLRGQLSG